MATRSVKQGQTWTHTEHDIQVSITDENLSELTESYCAPVWIEVSIENTPITPDDYNWLSLRAGTTYIARTELFQSFKKSE